MRGRKALQYASTEDDNDGGHNDNGGHDHDGAHDNGAHHDGCNTTSTTQGASSGLSVGSFNRNFTAMAELRPIVTKGSGGIGAIMPDTVSSTRYVEFDAPYLTRAMRLAGLTSTQISVVNAHGSDAAQLADAQAAITRGDKVLILDPLDSGTGAKIESYAASHGVKVVDYDRLTLGGSRAYYVSFDNVHVGELLGQGLVELH